MNTPADHVAIENRTIADFGEQWTRYTDNSGYYGSAELFDDVFAPLIRSSDLRGATVAEIGAGTGRFVRIYLEAGARRVLALEPSAAMNVIRTMLATLPHAKDRVTLVEAAGDRLPADGVHDFVFSIGVLHHIPHPQATCRAALAALRPGGTFGVWVYGREGNGAYLALFGLLHHITRRLPHSMLATLVWCMGWMLDGYIHACRIFPLPLRHYCRQVLARLTRDKRRLVIYDQLNPAYAKYYTEAEARALLEDAGFRDVLLHHRHGYSWTVVGRRAAS